jgi:hypothetical protein
LYIIRVALVPEDDDDDPAFGDEDSNYISIDMEMIARAPILSNEAETNDEDTSDLETNGPFVPTFPVDSKKVRVILLACFGLSSAWQYVKKFANQQNRCQVWHTLHDHFFGGDKVNTMLPMSFQPSRLYTTVVIGGISRSTSTALPTLTSTIVTPLLPSGMWRP